MLGGDLVLQVDLRDMKAADEKDAAVAAVIDRLAETLPCPHWLDGQTSDALWLCHVLWAWSVRL